MDRGIAVMAFLRKESREKRERECEVDGEREKGSEIEKKNGKSPPPTPPAHPTTPPTHTHTPPLPF